MSYSSPPNSKRLTKYAWLSIGAAVFTIALKATAYLLTDSVGLLSDALESVVNLFAAIVALFALQIAAMPPDDDHAYGHGKIEYFSSGVEGTLIIVAALGIMWASVQRLLTPQPIEQVEIGIFISALSAALNFFVARILLQVGTSNHSIALEADAKHLMTDVWTTCGVIVGVIVIQITDLTWIDPLIAILVAFNILREGYQMIYRSTMGLMDTALPQPDIDKIEAILEEYHQRGIETHALRTRQAGNRRFVSFHLLVPDQWTVRRGHDLAEEIEAKIRDKIPLVSVLTHLEPKDDPSSWLDTQLDR